jgi:hypothetical protein
MNLMPEQRARLDIDVALVAAAGPCRTVKPATWPLGPVVTANTTPLSTRWDASTAVSPIATQL